MRWNATASLISKPKAYQDSEGVWHEGELEQTPVFCNQRRVGVREWETITDLGLRADASIQLRACDYNDQAQLVMDGITYDVTRAQDRGDFVVLTLGKHVRDE